MKGTINGIIRRIDDLGRVVIPKDMMRNLGIENGDELVFDQDDTGMHVKLAKERCRTCGGTDGLRRVGEGFLCEACAIEAGRSTPCTK